MSDFQYLTIKQVVDSGRYPFTIGQLRHYLIFRHKNGLENAIRKFGKRIYVRQDLFEEWIESMSTQGGHS